MSIVHRKPFAIRMATCLVALLFGITATTASAQLRVLVTNDDGVDAEGLSVLVERLRENPNLDLTVIAPADEQSASGDDISTPVDVFDAFTAAGYPALAVTGEPGDTVLLAVLELLPEPPDVVISGINSVFNLGRDLAPFSGTVGAARWAARLGIPAIAASQAGGADNDYETTADYVAAIAQLLAEDKMTGSQSLPFDTGDGRGTKVLLSINVPNCDGNLRGFRVVALGSFSSPTSFTLQADDGMTRTYSRNDTSNINQGGCDSTLEETLTDFDAFYNGFGSITPLDESLSVSEPTLEDFKLLESLNYGPQGAVVSSLPGGGSGGLSFIFLPVVAVVFRRLIRRIRKGR